MGGIRVEGNTSGHVAEVDSENNLLVALSKTPGKIGGVRNFSENDPGDISGSPYLKSPEVSADFRLRVGIDDLLFQDNFNATAQNTQLWKYVSSTLTCAQSGGFLQVNSGAAGNTGTYVSMQTFQFFPLLKTAPLYLDFNITLSAAPIPANERFRIGLFVPNTTNLPIDGAYIVLSNAGLQLVFNFNGTETAHTIAAFSPLPNTSYHFCLSVSTTEIEVWIDDEFYGEFETPAGNSQPFMQGSLPLAIECVNTGTVTGAMVLKVGNVQVSLADFPLNQPYAELQGAQSLSGNIGQNGGTMGQTTQWSNTALPTAAAGTNTSAALGTGLGGLFRATAPATSATDIIISSFQNPANGINQTGRNLIIKGVWIDMMNEGAAAATTATGLAIALAFGHTAVSLATTETASFATGTTHAPRKIPIGFLWIPSGAVIGQTSSNGKQFVQFATPIVVRPGEFVAMVAKIIVGTATASENLLFAVGFDAYFQ